jgi:hypothetical protein
MRCSLIPASFALAVAAFGCDETHHSNIHDMDMAFPALGTPCAPDQPPFSACGYWPRHFCAPAGVCAAACAGNDDCPAGTVCAGVDLGAGQCQAGASDGGP